MLPPQGIFRPQPAAGIVPRGLQGVAMSRIQNFALGLVMAAIGVAAFVQIIPADHIWRLVSIAALGTIAIFGAMVFLSFAFGARPK